MSLYIDMHSHLDHPLIAKRTEEIIVNAQKVGIKHIVANGIDPASNRACLALTKKYEMVKCGMGVYPRDSLAKEAEEHEGFAYQEYNVDEEISFIEEHAKDIVALSEVGLDFVHGQSKIQEEDFVKMIALSKKLDKPLVIHSRKAEERCIELLEEHKAKKVVMHCFCGKKRLVKKILDNKWSMSIPTTVTRAQQFQEIVKMAPLSLLFCETDSPFLSPYKEGWNEPAFVLESYKKIAEIKELELQEVMNAVYMNWQQMFE